MKIKNHVLFSLVTITAFLFLYPTDSYARAGDCGDIKNPKTNSIETRPTSGAICRQWETFWCLVDKEVGAIGWKCRALIALNSTEQIESAKNSYAGEFLKYTLSDPRFMNKIKKCQGFNKAQEICATAGNFEKCMEIKWNKEYRKLRSTCE